MTTETVLIIGVIVSGFASVLYLLNQRLSQIAESKKDDEAMRIMSDWMKQTLEQVQLTRKEMQGRLDFTGKAINERLDNAAKVIGSVSKELGEMSEIGRQMKDLQDFLKSPKLRGNIGEQVLKELLGQMLPKQSFHLQYGFKTGSVVDAAIKTANGIIPIDSKFPMEGFRKMMGAETQADKITHERQFVNDVRKHIRDISSKYILTEEGTIDYALMYIPSEAVYYEVVNNPELFEYAGTHRVLPVSPMTFYAYLKAILMSFEGQKIEEKAKYILNSLKAVEADTERFGEDFRILLKHVTNAKNMADSADSRFRQLQTRVESVRGLPGVEEPPQLPLATNSD
jgi:DNA recombination protein RmuC